MAVPLDNLLIHNLEHHIVNIKGNIGGVLQFRVKIEKSVVDVNTFQKKTALRNTCCRYA